MQASYDFIPNTNTFVYRLVVYERCSCSKKPSQRSLDLKPLRRSCSGSKEANAMRSVIKQHYKKKLNSTIQNLFVF